VERVDAKVEDHKKEVERVRVQERIEKEHQHKQIVEQQQ
jgi:predicted XRE-type DNA-binding protein